MKKEKSDVPFNYVTIKTTQSRIDKGLLAIPVTLIDIFPKNRKKILIVDINGNEDLKNFTPYNSSSRECRIGGLKNFYEKHSIKDGDELVIQIIDDDKFKIVPEKIFKRSVIDIENELLDAKTEEVAEKKLIYLSKVTNEPKEEVARSEFLRLSSQANSPRGIHKYSSHVKESVPAPIKKILLEIYKGRCQISNFTFLTSKGIPYFEIHHIKPKEGHYIKNLLVVSPNVHAQFTHSKVKLYYDNESWLRKVRFNEEEYFVRQAIDFMTKEYIKEVHFE
jgi:hypothetical protein